MEWEDFSSDDAYVSFLELIQSKNQISAFEEFSFTPEDRILTLGMYPNRPETGYGYIKAKPLAQEEILEVEGFKEKPDLQTAQRYLAEGGYFWNAGIFLWNVNTIERAFRKEQPEIVAVFDGLNEVFYTPEEQGCIDEKFPTCPNISIDYAIMEKADNIYVFPADFG